MTVIPDHLEEVFLAWGPPTFKRLVHAAGGKIQASELAQVSSSTMSRWVQSPPGALFGQRKNMRSYRALWFGYPNPFPGLDRLVEEVCGPEHSFIAKAVEKYGLLEALDQMRDPERSGLRMLGLADANIIAAAHEIGVPPMTRRRWTSDTPYPRQWTALDRLATAIDGTSWLQSALAYGHSVDRSRKISPEGIASMVQAVLSSA